MKTLYFDCPSGISGDMTAACLLDLGVPRDTLLSGINSLGLSGFEISIGRTQKSGIGATGFDVLLEDRHGHEENGDHGHEHGHAHEHRNLSDIQKIIVSSGLNENTKSIALSIFEKLAQAEGKIHGMPPDQVHFHEVGALDSIVDIVSAAICIDWIGPDSIEFSVLREGSGFVNCQHGLIPVPAPATLELLRACGAQVDFTDIPGEMITPTGAAIAAAAGRVYGAPCPMGRVAAVGYGAGKKDFEHPNLLRAMLVESDGPVRDEVCVLETVVDDCSGEELGFAMELLFAAGVKDAHFTPVYMKKNRPAVELTVICAPGVEETAAEIIFRHTSAIGMRKTMTERIVMDRRVETRNTRFGPVEVKTCRYGGIEKSRPEYESVAAAAKKHGVSIREVENGLKG